MSNDKIDVAGVANNRSYFGGIAYNFTLVEN